MTSNQGLNFNIIKNTSSILSNSMFKKIVHKNDYSLVEKKISKYLLSNSNLKISTYDDFYTHLYTTMLNEYRNEFIYKNEIVNKILLGKYSLNTATIFNEFKIGKSIADIVMLNGTSIVYEIKTEYDSPERLLSQINEYKKSFLNIVIVTHHTVVDKYRSFLLKNNLPNIGLLSFTKRKTLTEIIPPKPDNSFLNIDYMFKCLRKDEYSKLIMKYFGYLPNVPNTKLFRECLNLARKIAPEEFHDFMFNYLKKRNIKEKNLVSSSEIPNYLKHISISSDFKKKDLEKINIFLNKKLE